MKDERCWRSALVVMIRNFNRNVSHVPFGIAFHCKKLGTSYRSKFPKMGNTVPP